MIKYALLLPAVGFSFIFTLWPLLEAGRLSFLQTNFITTKFVGLQNYIDSFSNEAFLQSAFNSLAYMAVFVPGQILLSLAASICVFRLSKRWQDAARIIFYVPTLAAGIIIAQVWRWIFHQDGFVNWILAFAGIESISWFAQGLTAIPAVALIVLTASFGGCTILLLASLQSIDKAIFDAARIDGASWRQTKWRIIVPILAPTVGMIALLSAISALQVFETIYALAPYDYAATMAFHIYRQGFQFSKYGLASAQAVILLAATVGISLVKNKVAA